MRPIVFIYIYIYNFLSLSLYIYIYIYIYIYLKLWGLSISNLFKVCGKIANLKHVRSGCQYSLRSYTWRHDEILGIIAEIAKMCCKTANEIPYIKTNIQFVKEGNVSKTSHRNNSHKPTPLDGCTDWRVIPDVDRQLAFPTKITSTRQRPDLVIWSVNSKKVSITELTIPFENDWSTDIFLLEIGCRGFISNATSTFLTKIWLTPAKKGEYIKKDPKKGCDCIWTDMVFVQIKHHPIKSGSTVRYCWDALG